MKFRSCLPGGVGNSAYERGGMVILHSTFFPFLILENDVGYIAVG